MPAARAIPWTSSGEVSARTRMAARPASAAATAASGVVAISPDAIPGDAGRPVTSGVTAAGPADGRRRWIGQQRRDPRDRLRARQRERRVLGHVDGDPQSGLRAALADPDLEEPEPAVLDRELDVAQVGVVVLEAARALPQLGGDGRKTLVERRDRLGRVRPGDDVLALGIEQDVAVERRLAGRRVARERDAGRRRRAAVAEDHRLDRDRGPEVVGDPLLRAVRAGTVAVPRAEDGLDRETELLPRVVGDVGDADDRAEAGLEPLAAAPRERLAAGRAGQARLRWRRSARGRGSCPSSRASTPAPRTAR